MTVNNSSISNNSTTYNDGGGIYSYQGTLRVNSSAIYNNSAVNGGGLYSNGGTIDITNSTFSSNTADPVIGSGGAIATTGAGPMTINNSTISNNSAFYGGGIASIAAVTIRNTIIANSVSGGDCAGSITNGGNNIIEDNTCSFVGGNDPLLGPLANNGGHTLTHALLSGSPAIDAGSAAGCTDAQGNPLTADQRGMPRPQGGRCDIGAYEYNFIAPTLNFPSNGNTSPTTRPLFDWANVTGATSYTLQISTQQNFSTFVLNSIISPSAYVMPTDLPRNTLLFWRVRANSIHGPSDWSRTRHFFSANPPSVPVLVSPANAAVVSPPPTLDWNDSSPAADYYEVQIATVSTFATFLGRGFSGKAYQSNFTPQAALSPGTPYFWRVRAVKNSGAGLEFSDWSAVRSFTTP
ncbi:MAG: right-handed parallel beta-helix repeat-containing protein [Chloroflexi bacterium]|nr:right-handed parallel beta-helix repeat-containing protein [Chloroflexota bacterium]